MSKRLPAGTIRQRSDGSVWSKPTSTSKEWTQVKDGTAGSGSTKGQASKVAEGPSAPEEEVQLPWRSAQARYGLDGHLPPEEVHPQHVTIDTEGNIDAKPVLMWKDAYGASRRTYTENFHWNRYGEHHTAQKATWDDLQLAHQNLRDLASEGSQVAMAALVALQTGRSPEDVCDLHHERVQPVSEGVEKGGDTGDRTHPDRVHLTFQHAKGHAYTTSLLDPVLSKHASGVKASPDEDGRVFKASPEEVRGLLAEHKLDPDDSLVRHHVATNLAVDMLSKTEPAKLDTHGIEALRATLQEISDKLAAHFGHDPAPPGMSYVPPAVAIAYLEEAGGEKHFPKSYAKLKGLPVQSENVKKSDDADRRKAEKAVLKAFGTLEGREADVETVLTNLQKKRNRMRKGKEPCSVIGLDSSFTPLTSTSSPPEATLDSTPTTPVAKSSTAGPSAPSSPVLDPVLEKGQYVARLGPLAGELKARYVYEAKVFEQLLASPYFEKVVNPGARFWCPMNGVDGYVHVESRQGNLVTLSHSGTGKRGTDHVDALKQLLLSFHTQVAPTVPEAPPVALAQLAAELVPYLEKHSEKEEREVIYPQLAAEHEAEEEAEEEVEEEIKEEKKVKKSYEAVLSDIGSRPPVSDQFMAAVQALYVSALKRNLVGELSDERMRAINMALYHRDYAEVARLAKGAGEPPPPTTRHRPQPDPTKGAGKLPPPTTKPQASKPHASGHGGVSTAELRDLLSRLRAQLHTAPKGQRAEIKQRIDTVREKLQASAHKGRESTQKADAQVQGLVKASWEVNDPMEAWLRKSAMPLSALDSFILASEQSSFEGFALDLLSAPLEVRAQARFLRLQKGDGALRARWEQLGGEVF